MIYKFGERTPIIRGDYYLADGAKVMGSVDIGHGVSFWFNAVVRADEASVTIGEYSNVQECAVIHVDKGSPVSIGARVVIGHNAMVHGCTIGNGCLIGINSVVLDDAHIGDNCLIGANALVPSGMIVPAGSLVLGSPARVVRPLRQEELDKIAGAGDYYWRQALKHKDQLQPLLQS